MGGRKPAIRGQASWPKPADLTNPLPGRGVGRLLNGGENGGVSTTRHKTEEDYPPPAGIAPAQLPKWPFFLADLLLLSFVGLLVWQSAPPLAPGIMVLCALGIVVGAIIALLPFWLEARRKAATRPADKPAVVRLRISLQ